MIFVGSGNAQSGGHFFTDHQSLFLSDDNCFPMTSRKRCEYGWQARLTDLFWRFGLAGSAQRWGKHVYRQACSHDHARIRLDSERAIDLRRAKEKMPPLCSTFPDPSSGLQPGLTCHPIHASPMPGPSQAAMDLAWSYARGVTGHCWYLLLFAAFCWGACPKMILDTKGIGLLRFFFRWTIQHHPTIVEAPCTEIIQRATSTIDYDQRAEKQSHSSTGAPISRVCPVLRELYQADETHSDS